MGNKDVKKTNATSEKVDPTVYVVFVSLLLDLLAFTMILPLLPSLLEYYRLNDGIGLYTWLSDKISYFQTMVGAPERFNSVLFGGCLGSMFSFLQFVASPVVGSISDVVGRKPVMICCLVGIAFSYVLWALSNNFALFILARFIGGLSKGNVSLSMAIIADVSNVHNRGKGMALVGIAFSVGFIVGPMIGAIFAVWARSRTGTWYTVPAAFATFLAVLDLLYFAFRFRETLPPNARKAVDVRTSLNQAASLINIPALFKFNGVRDLRAADRARLQRLGLVYFVYLFLYSGLEFTLTFLTHHVFGYGAVQQGWMFAGIGLVMAIVQGGYVRRVPASKTHAHAVYGLWLVVPAFAFVGFARPPVDGGGGIWGMAEVLLAIGLFLFACSTALVVPCMMTMAAEFGTAQEKGVVMGIFRSLGALARAVGPTFASVAFWSVGATSTYLLGAVLLLWPVLTLRRATV